MIDILTVVFQPEIFYIQIQARSIEQYIDSSRIKNIYVVVNDHEHVCDLIKKEWWGTNQDRVKIIHRSQFGECHTLPGWHSQQYYKLAMAAECTAPWSMCLDAKTWFIQRLEWENLFDQQNRVKMYSFPTIPVFKDAEKFVENYFGISCKKVIGPGGVPFFFSTQEVKLLCQHFKRKNTSLKDFFSKHSLDPFFVTEFMLYSAWINYLYGSHEKLYNQQQFYKVRNIADFERHDFDELYQEMLDPNCLTASIHLSVYPYLSEQQMLTWIDFLHKKQLITDIQHTLDMLNTANVE